MSDPSFARFIALLTLERSAIVAADFDTIERISAEKQDMLHDWGSRRHNAQDAAALMQKLEQNQSLLRASIDGVASARERLIALGDVQAGMRTYDQAGHVSKLPNNQSALNKQS